MKKKIAIILLVLISIILIGQLAFGKYNNLFIPIIWIFLISIPILVKTPENSNQNLLVVYFVIAFLTIVLQPIFLAEQGIGSVSYLTISFSWLLPLQIFFWLRIAKLINFNKEKQSSTESEQSMDLEKINHLISKNEIKLALAETSEINYLTTNQKNEVLNMIFRHEEAKRKNRLGVISNGDLSIEKNKIVTGLIELVSILKDDYNISQSKV